MANISEEEKLRRRRIVSSVLGTHAMEGLSPDAGTADLLERYESGELTLDAFSSAMDKHALELVALHRPLVNVA